MEKRRELGFWFRVFMVQLVAACFIPTVVLLLLPPGDSPIRFETESLTIHNKTPHELEQVLESHYRNILEEGYIVLESKEISEKIPYTSFELQINVESMVHASGKAAYDNRFFQIIGKKNENKNKTQPEVYYNEATLKELLAGKKDLFLENAENARLVLQEDTVRVIPHQKGSQLNVEKALNHIRRQCLSGIQKEIIISKTVSPDIFSDIEPEVTGDRLAHFSHIHTLVTGKCTDDNMNAIQALIKRLNNKILVPGENFSFVNETGSVGTESARMIFASAIYRSILPIEEIKVTYRQSANQPVLDIEAGFEVNLEGQEDFKFENASDAELAWICHMEASGEWTVALAGNSSIVPGEIKTERIAIPPPIIYTQQAMLLKNEQRVLEPGQEGLSVKVYRVTKDKTEELYETVYQPVSRVIAIGEGIGKESIVVK